MAKCKQERLLPLLLIVSRDGATKIMAFLRSSHIRNCTLICYAKEFSFAINHKIPLLRLHNFRQLDCLDLSFSIFSNKITCKIFLGICYLCAQLYAKHIADQSTLKKFFPISQLHIENDPCEKLPFAAFAVALVFSESCHHFQQRVKFKYRSLFSKWYNGVQSKPLFWQFMK